MFRHLFAEGCLGLFLIGYDIRLVGGYFHLLPRIFWSMIGFLLVLDSTIHIFQLTRIADGGQVP
jgi:hypothetical protein